jgi:hypothetical protein
VILDHNRMLVEAELRRSDGTWIEALLWVDTGNPEFFLSERIALELGIDLSRARGDDGRPIPSLDVPAPAGIRIGGMELRTQDVPSKVMFEPIWLFDTMHNDANLPSTILRHYQVVFDYPNRELTIAEPGSLVHRGSPVTASVHPTTGIVQVDAVVGGDSMSLALDNGASYSFLTDDIVEGLVHRNPDWPVTRGAYGCANIWGWWPQEESWTVLRVPEVRLGSTQIAGVGIVGLPEFYGGGPELGEWYSAKTVHRVEGFLGPNAFKAFRIEIDYAGGAVYFERDGEFDTDDMDIVGLTLRPLADGSYEVLGVAALDGGPLVEGVLPGDKLLQVGDLVLTSATMGAVVDALRGKPGELRVLVLEREGQRITVEAKVARIL